MLFDAHIHSEYSADSESPMEAVCRHAVARGLAGICFTDHAEFTPGDIVPAPEEMDAMYAEITALRGRFAGQLEIGFGIEVGYHVGTTEAMLAFLAAYPFDYVLGSIHVVDGIYYSMPHDEGNGNPARYYDRYLDELQAMLDVIPIHAVGHFDLPKRFGPPLCDKTQGFAPGSPLWTKVQGILSDIVKRNIVLEINASGWRQHPGEPYPSLPVLIEFARLGGGGVTLGSDGHQPEHVGEGLAAAARWARRAGLTRQAWFMEGQARWHPLPDDE